MEDTKQVIENLILQINEVTNKFYQQSDKKRFDQFQDVLNNLLRLTDGLEELKQSTGKVYIEQNHYIEVLTNAMNALECQDETLLADILQYDLLEILIDLEKNMK